MTSHFFRAGTLPEQKLKQLIHNNGKKLNERSYSDRMKVLDGATQFDVVRRLRVANVVAEPEEVMKGFVLRAHRRNETRNDAKQLLATVNPFDFGTRELRKKIKKINIFFFITPLPIPNWTTDRYPGGRLVDTGRPTASRRSLHIC